MIDTIIPLRDESGQISFVYCPPDYETHIGANEEGSVSVTYSRTMFNYIEQGLKYEPGTIHPKEYYSGSGSYDTPVPETVELPAKQIGNIVLIKLNKLP